MEGKLLIFTIFILTFFAISAVGSAKAKCTAEIRKHGVQEVTMEKIRCNQFGTSNNARTEFTISNPDPFSNPSFEELTRSVQKIVFDHFENITIAEDFFSVFPNLTILYITPGNAIDHPQQGRLDIHPLAFRNVRNLKKLHLHRLILTDNACSALENLKTDHFRNLWIGRCSPSYKLLKAVSEFTNLTDFQIDICDQNNDKTSSIPENLFQKSSSNLEKIQIYKCDVPIIKSNMFANLTKLKELRWSNNNSTKIEAGAFDGMTNVKRIQMVHNRFEQLPDGLFKNNKKLTYVQFRQHEHELSVLQLNLSRENFTHCDTEPVLSMRD